MLKSSLAVLLALAGAAWAAAPTLAELESKLEKLDRPIRVTEAEMFRDGGTVVLKLQDGKAIAIEIACDGRISSDDPGALFYGGHPGREPAPPKLPRGEALEKKVLGLLQEWLDQKGEDAKHAGLVAGVLDAARKKK